MSTTFLQKLQTALNPPREDRLLPAAVEYIEKLNNIKVDVNQLISEYNENIKSKMSLKKIGNADVQYLCHLMSYDEYLSEINLMKYTSEVLSELKKTFDFNFVTYRNLNPFMCYNWHVDSGELCYHIPLITQPGSRFVYEEKSFHLPSDGSVYVVNNGIPHTFANAGFDQRLHIMIEYDYV